MHLSRVVSFCGVALLSVMQLTLFPPLLSDPEGNVKGMEVVSQQRPNLIFLMTDQQRYDALSLASGLDAILQTPNMDRIGREGAYFRRAYSQCPVCGPARTSLLTGLAIAHTGVRTNQDAQSPNITNLRSYDDYLIDEGYVAEYYGKWHSPPSLGAKYSNGISLQMNGPYTQYLDRQNLTEPPPQAMENGTQIQSFNRQPYWTNPLDDRHGLPPGSRVNLHGERVLEPHQHGISTIPEEHTLTAFDARRALDALERLATSAPQQPFSLHLSWFTPHAPVTPSEPYASRYDPQTIPIPASIHDPMHHSPYPDANGRKLHPEYRDSQRIGYMMANYYAYIAEIDVWVGHILDALDRWNLTDNTLLVFTSDHGEMLGSHGMIEKNVFYEESVHVPLLMRFPGRIPRGTVVDTPVSHTDLLATILDFVGAAPQPSDGDSLRPLVEERSADGDGRGFAVSEWDYGRSDREPGLMIRTTRWKLFLPTRINAKVPTVLYDLESDPWEMRNLLGEPKDRQQYLPQAEALRHELVGWLRARNHASLDEVMNLPL